MIKSIPINIINLKKSVERREYMHELCYKHQFDFRFIDAVDGSLLDQGYVDQIYSYSESEKNIGRGLGSGEVGCALSHLSIYKNIVDNNLEMSVVFEDDIMFDEGFLDIFNHIDKIPDDSDILLFGHHPERSREAETCVRLFGRTKLNDNYCIARPGELACGTYAYLIKNSGAKKMLDLMKVITMPVDHFTGSEKYLNVYVVHPSIVRIHDNYSDKLQNMSDRAILQRKQNCRTILNKKNRLKFLLRKFKTYLFLSTLYKQIKYALCSIKISKRYH